MIPIAKPLIGLEEIKNVLGVLNSGTIAEGPKVHEFEGAFAQYIGVDHATAVNSGTAALQAALLAQGIGKGDEVITTPFTFIATANAILFTGAKPVFADVEADTFNIDPEEIQRRITRHTKAIIPVHLYGHPAEMATIMDIAEDSDVVVIEDACQAHGAVFHGKKVGSFGIGCFSFYPTKNMTTSEGGIITSNDAGFDEKVRMIKSHGSRVRYYHEVLGYNLRMTDISAAIGLAQIKKVDEYNEKRKANARRLSVRLNGIEGLITPIPRPGCTHVFHQYTIRITSDFGVERDELVRDLTAAGIGTGVYYPCPIHKQPLYEQLGYSESHLISEQLSNEVLSLPVHPSVTAEDVDMIAAFLQEVK